MPFNKSRKNRGGFNRGRNSRNKIPRKQEKRVYRQPDQLSEHEVGISEYISTVDGYEAVIKARYSDFQVNEINLDGEMAKLSNTKMPDEFKSKVEKNLYEQTEITPIGEIPQDIWEALKKSVSDPKAELVSLDVVGLNKDDRRKIHECIKSHFGQKIVPKTVTKDNKTVIEFGKPSKTGDNRATWPEGLPEYVYFILYKESMDTMDACLRISQAINIKPNNITYAGVKDRRAKTSQWLCIKKVQPWKLFARTRFIKTLKIGNITFKEKPLEIGDLKGNKFRIALRNVKADDDLINASMKQVQDHGFINYYGLQRFGNDREVPTYQIGLKLLLKQWKEAVDLILKVKSAEDAELKITLAKKMYNETGNAKQAVEMCDRFENCLEFKLLEGLAKNGKNDYVNALENIPRSTRLMYIHSFQSLIWNRMASKRFKEFGLKPVIGDLVYINNPDKDESLYEPIDDTETENSTNENTEVEPVVKALTAEDIDKYSIYDIVLPLPGYNIIYPEHMKEFYKEAIEEFGLQLTMPKQSVKTYNLCGTYRKFLNKVQDLKWKIMYFNDPTDNLILSDLGEMLGEQEPKSIQNGKYKAVVLEFILSSSSYATMVLREMLKCSTANSVQAQLNNYGEAKPKVIIEVENDEETKEEPEVVMPGSLLANKAKYEDFKNRLFQDMLQETEQQDSTKRDLESDEHDISSKKMKTD